RWPRRRCGSALPSCRSRRVSWPGSVKHDVWSEAEGMKPKDVRALTDDALGDELMKLKKEQFNLRFQKASGQMEHTARGRQVRRDIARIKTVQAERAAAATK